MSEMQFYFFFFFNEPHDVTNEIQKLRLGITPWRDQVNWGDAKEGDGDMMWKCFHVLYVVGGQQPLPR